MKFYSPYRIKDYIPEKKILKNIFLLTELWIGNISLYIYMNDDPNAYKQMFQFYSKLLSNKNMENCGEISYFSVMENLLCDLYDVIEDVTNVLWNLDKWFFPSSWDKKINKYLLMSGCGRFLMIDGIFNFYLISKIWETN